MESNDIDNIIKDNRELDKIRQITSGCLSGMSPQQFSMLASTIGVALTCGLNLDQQNSLGNFIVSVGQSMLTVAAAGAGQLTEQEAAQQNREMQNRLQVMKKQLAEMEEKIFSSGGKK